MLLTLTLDFIEYLGKPPFNIKGCLEQDYGAYSSPIVIEEISLGGWLTLLF